MSSLWFKKIVEDILGKSETIFAYLDKDNKVKLFKQFSFVTDGNIDSEFSNEYLSAVLCADIYCITTNPSDGTEDDNKRSNFIKGEYRSARHNQKDVKRLREKAVTVPEYLFKNELEKIRSLIETTAYYRCVRTYKDDASIEKMPIDKVKDSVQKSDYLVSCTELKNTLTNAFNKSKELKDFLKCSEEITVNNIDKALAGLVLLATFDNNYVFYESAEDEKEKIEAKKTKLELEKQEVEAKKTELELGEKDRAKKTKLAQREQRIEAKKTELALREQQIEAEKIILDSIRKVVVAKEEVNVPEKLAACYWSSYRMIGAQKQFNRSRQNLQKRLGEVFQKPELVPLYGDAEWGWKEGVATNLKLVSPNGYGKTSCLRAILLSLLQEYNDDLSEKERETFNSIRTAFKLPERCLPIYLECRYMKDLSSEDGCDWIFNTLEKCLILPDDLTKDALLRCITDYLNRSKVLLLIDGYDEIDKASRKVLAEKLENFRKTLSRKSGLSIVLATRPLSSEPDLPGNFQEWKIKSIRSYDEEKLKAFVQDYCDNNTMDANEIMECIDGNPYLKELLSTPAICVWAILKISRNVEPVYQMVNNIIHEIMSRYHSDDLSDYDIIQCTKVYMELAHKYLASLHDVEGIPCSNFLAWVTKEIQRLIKNSSDEWLKEYLEEAAEDMEELEQLFFSRVPLLEHENGYLRFSSNVFAIHLAALRIVRKADSEPTEGVICELEEYDYQYRYRVMVAALSIAENSGAFDVLSINKGDLSEEVADVFAEYMMKRYNAEDASSDEKDAIVSAVEDILKERYGRNAVSRLKNSKYTSVAELCRMGSEADTV